MFKRSWGLLLVVAGCAAPYRQVVTQLGSVDLTRPHVVYAPAQGKACGDNALKNAIADLERFSNVDGFLSVTVEEVKGDTAEDCVVVTGRPVTSGCEARTLALSEGPGPKLVRPGPMACGVTADSCRPDCQKYASTMGAGETQTTVLRERCVRRCTANDSAFLACARAVVDAAGVGRCEALPEP